MQRLSGEVKSCGADAVLIVGEAWIGAPDESGFLRPLSKQKNEGEVLTMIVASSEEQVFQLFASIERRRFRKPLLGKTLRSSEGNFILVEPILEVWRSGKA